MSNRHPVYKHIENHLPTFCWQTVYEILIMLEGVDPDVDYDAVKVAVTRMSRGACPRIQRRTSDILIGKRRRSSEPELLYRFNPAFERERAKRRGVQSHAKLTEMISPKPLLSQSIPSLRVPPQYTPRLGSSLSPAPAHTSSKSYREDASAI